MKVKRSEAGGHPVEPCAVCDTHVPVDGDHAAESEGRVICRDCITVSVTFRADCGRFDCGWSYEWTGTEPERMQVENLVRNEANNHEMRTRVFDGDHGHHCEITEVES